MNSPSTTQDTVFCSQAYNHLTSVCRRLHTRPSEIQQAPPHRHIIHIQPRSTQRPETYYTYIIYFDSTRPTTSSLSYHVNCCVKSIANLAWWNKMTTMRMSLSAQKTSDTGNRHLVQSYQRKQIKEAAQTVDACFQVCYKKNTFGSRYGQKILVTGPLEWEKKREKLMLEHCIWKWPMEKCWRLFPSVAIRGLTAAADSISDSN